MSLSGSKPMPPRLFAARPGYPPCSLRRPGKCPRADQHGLPLMRWRRSLSSRSRARDTSCRPPSFYQAYAGFATSTEYCSSSMRSKAGWVERENVRRRALGSRRGYPAWQRLPMACPCAIVRQGVGHGLAQRQLCVDLRWQPCGAASLATIRLLENRYIRNANRRGQLCEGLSTLAERFSFIREVRGLGLMIGVEIQSETGGPASTWRRTHRRRLPARSA